MAKIAILLAQHSFSYYFSLCWINRSLEIHCLECQKKNFPIFSLFILTDHILLTGIISYRYFLNFERFLNFILNFLRSIIFNLNNSLFLGNGKDDAGGSLIFSTHGQPDKRNPGGQNHLSDALLRLLFIKKKDDDDSADYVGTTDTSRTRLRYVFFLHILHNLKRNS